jgi:hypothetical protein
MVWYSVKSTGTTLPYIYLYLYLLGFYIGDRKIKSMKLSANLFSTVFTNLHFFYGLINYILL